MTKPWQFRCLIRRHGTHGTRDGDALSITTGANRLFPYFKRNAPGKRGSRAQVKTFLHREKKRPHKEGLPNDQRARGFLPVTPAFARPAPASIPRSRARESGKSKAGPERLKSSRRFFRYCAIERLPLNWEANCASATVRRIPAPARSRRECRPESCRVGQLFRIRVPGIARSEACSGPIDRCSPRRPAAPGIIGQFAVSNMKRNPIGPEAARKAAAHNAARAAERARAR